MSGDVQPRKRKDKRRKKDVSNVPAEYRAQKMRVVLEDLPGSEDVGSNTFSSDETIHVHKDTGTGGNICAKVVFFLLLGALAVMVGLILTEYRGSSDVDTPVTQSRWAQVFDGLVDESLLKHEEHGQLTEQSSEQDEEHSEEAEERGDGELDEHGEEGEEEGEEEEEEEEEVVDSEETQSPEQDEDEPISDEIEDGQEEEEEEEEEEEDEEVEELEVSEEELKDIPGVTESDEDEEEDDESTGAEEDVDDVASEEAGREEEEAARMSTVVPVKDTSPKLNAETPRKESQELRQRKDRPVAVSLEGERESPSIEMKSEGHTSQAGAKPSTSVPQAVQHDGANKASDKNTTSTNVIRGIPVTYDKDAPEHSAEPISSTSSTPAWKPSVPHTSESASVAHTTTEDPNAPHTSTEKGNIQIERPRKPHIPTGKPSAPHIPAEEPSAPDIKPEKPSVPHIQTEKPSAPHIPTEKPSTPHIPTEKSSVPHIPTEKPSAPQIPAEKPSAPHIPAEKPRAPHVPAEKPGAPHIPAEKPSEPHVPTEKPSAPNIPAEKLSSPHVPSEKPGAPHIPAEKPRAPHIPTGKPSAPHIPAENPSSPHVPAEKPGAPHIPAEKPREPHVPTEKPSAPNIPVEKLSSPRIPSEKPGAPHVPTEKLSSSSSEVPLTVIPKTASQPVRDIDLREDKLGLSKVTETSHSEYSGSIGVKPSGSQMSSKEPVGGTKQDTSVNQQQKEVEESQKAQTPESATQSAGKVPKEASVLHDKSAPKLSETVDTASGTSASKQKKAEGEDSDEDEGDGDDDSDDGDNEAVEELGGEETEGDKEGDLEDKDGVNDDTEEEPSGVALKFGVGVALVLVAHVVLVRKWNADDGTTVQTAASAQASDTDRGVEEIVPELIERRQTLISQDDLEGSEYSEEDEGEEEQEEEEEEEPQKVETFEDYIAKYRPQAVTKKELTSEEQRISPAESEEEEDEEKYTKEDSDEEEEEEEESEEEEEEQPRVISAPLQKSTRAAYISPEESGTEESEEEEVLPARRATKTSGGQAYGKADITSKDDLKISEHLDLVDAELDEWRGMAHGDELFQLYLLHRCHAHRRNLFQDKPDEALRAFLVILVTNPMSPRARYGKARALDQLAEKKHSNSLLQEAIDAYESVLSLGASVPDKLFVEAAERCINRMRFKGQYHTAIHIHKKLMQRFSDDPAHPNQLAVTYLMINRLTDAKRILEDTLRRWPDNGFAQVHYGFILKTGDNNNEAAVDYLTWGIASREPGTIDGRFFFHLGDALTRLGRHDEAGKVYELGVREGLFLSKYQRSLYNVDRLRAQPWWTPEETTYSKYFKKLEDNWQHIREEGLAVLANKVFKDEAENLRDVGNWQQFELFARGRKIATNCEKAPFTCQLISEFPAARDCRRGQAKFSVMHAGTHVWPHCGPTNCRLRSHLGLIVPQGTYIRVAEETRTWEEGKLFIFDDSFEHEVWHNGTTTRLVLIVDVWHPELTEAEKKSMPSI